MNSVLLCLAGLAALILGAELVVRAGTRIATLLGVPPMLIGLTIVSVGTSLPELAIGIDAAIKDAGPLVVGNVAGTNTFNLLFILGLSALLAPVRIDRRTLRIDLPVMVAVAAMLLVFAGDLVLTRTEGAVLIAAGLVYTVLLFRGVRREEPHLSAEFDEAFAKLDGHKRLRLLATSGALLAAGLAVIVFGSGWLVDGATGLARAMGISDALIGLTVVAIGTSSPELVTTVVSTMRGKRDIAIGNLIGSGVYNVVFILGATLLVPSGGVTIDTPLLQVDLPVMVAATVACLPVLLNRTMSRPEGSLFVAAYCVYLGYLIVART